MTTPIHKQHSDDPLAPFALPDILRPDGRNHSHPVFVRV